MEAVLTVKAGAYVLEIHQDDCSGDSSRDWDNLGLMVCFHRGYNLGDKHDFATPDDFKRAFSEEGGVALPLYLIDHSGISMNTSGFGHCDPGGWDSGQVGYIWCSATRIREEYHVQRITKRTREKVREVLRDEVETYDQYLTGDVYGFILRKEPEPAKCECCDRKYDLEEVDSCWGFYGRDWKDNGLAECLPDEVTAALLAA
jgi:hypothetical protein